MISYEPLWETLKRKGFSKKKLNTEYDFSKGTLSRLNQGKPINTTTLNDLCKILNCRVEDVLLYVDDDEEGL